MKRPLIAAGLLLATLVFALFVPPPAAAPSLEQFATDSANSVGNAQEQVAQLYLKYYSPQQLTSALAETYPGARCHSQAHGLGRAIYKQTLNLSSAMATCGTQCNEGCFHGVLMQMFSTDSDTLGGIIEDETADAYIAHVEAVAKDLCSQPEVAGIIKPIFCVHGLGHVFMYVSNYDLKKALPHCVLFNPAIRSGCYFGLFMEYIAAPAVQQHLSTSDVTYCQSVPLDARKACYNYMSALWIVQHTYSSESAIMQACTRLNSDDALLCIHGASFQYGRRKLVSAHIDVDGFCSGLTDSMQRACVSGLIDSVVDNDTSATNEDCKIFTDSYRSECKIRLERSRNVKA